MAAYQTSPSGRARWPCTPVGRLDKTNSQMLSRYSHNPLLPSTSKGFRISARWHEPPPHATAPSTVGRFQFLLPFTPNQSLPALSGFSHMLGFT